MAKEKAGPGLIAVTASSDLSSSQYLFVKIDGEDTVGLAGAGEAVAGVLQNKPGSGEAASVWSTGSTSKITFGATVADGADVTPDAAGKAVTAASGDYVAGTVQEGGDADQIGTLPLTNPGRTA